MDPKTYEKVTNACILLAVACALLFERVGDLRWLMGTLGIVAGVVAVAFYFINQNSEQNANSPNEQTLLSAPHPGLQQIARPMQPSLKGPKEFNWAHAAQKSLYHALLQRQDVKRRGSRHYVWSANLVQTLPRRKVFVEEQRPGFNVREVVEIVRRLCDSDESTSFEFTIARDGSFTIRTTKTPPSWNVGRPSVQEEEAIEDAPHPQKPN
jgi:hypothetical protein